MPFFLKIYRRSSGDDLQPLHVQLMRKRPVNSTPIEAFYVCAVEFSSPDNVLTFSASDITRKLNGANPQVALAIEEVITRYVVEFDANNIATQVMGIVAKIWVYREPSRDQIASEMSLTSRTLQRRFLEQDNSLICMLMCKSSLLAVFNYLSSCRRVTSSHLTEPLMQ